MNLRAKDKRGNCSTTQHSTMTRKSLKSLIIERTLTHTVNPCDGHAWNKQSCACAFSRRIKTQTLRGQRTESYGSFPPSPTSKDIPFKSKPRSCWPGSNVSLRIRQQPVGGAGRWSGGVTDQYAAQADKHALLGLDGPAIVTVRQYCCSQLTVSLSVSKARLSCKLH